VHRYPEESPEKTSKFNLDLAPYILKDKNDEKREESNREENVDSRVCGRSEKA